MDKIPTQFHRLGNCIEKSTKTPTMATTEANKRAMIQMLRHAVEGSTPEMVQILLDHGASPNCRFDNTHTTSVGPLNNDTPLTFAAKLGRIDILQVLLKNGADPTLVCNDCRRPEMKYTPYEMARHWGREHAARFLHEWGNAQGDFQSFKRTRVEEPEPEVEAKPEAETKTDLVFGGLIAP